MARKRVVDRIVQQPLLVLFVITFFALVNGQSFTTRVNKIAPLIRLIHVLSPHEILTNNNTMWFFVSLFCNFITEEDRSVLLSYLDFF